MSILKLIKLYTFQLSRVQLVYSIFCICLRKSHRSSNSVISRECIRSYKNAVTYGLYINVNERVHIQLTRKQT